MRGLTRLSFLLAAIPPIHAVEAQRAVDITVGITPALQYGGGRSSQAGREVLPTYIPADTPSPAPYVVIGALVGAVAAGLWEAHAVSKNGDDVIGPAALMWIPPAAGAVLGGIGGWLVFKMVHSRPTTD
jgi:hypothetical protein